MGLGRERGFASMGERREKGGGPVRLRLEVMLKARRGSCAMMAWSV